MTRALTLRTWLIVLPLAGPAAAQAEAELATRPPPSDVDFLQYGVALTGETVASPGGVCADGSTCIFDSGGGLAIRVGYRSRGPWYLGGAYEFSRHDSNNLLRLPILQQLRAEGRHYLDVGARATPFGTVAAGALVYGNEWGAETWGLLASVGAGVDFQVTREFLVGAALLYRPLAFRAWTDAVNEDRADDFAGFGLAHVVAIELELVLRKPLPRW